jgi:DNA polymerase III delta prime subunit
VKTSAVEHMQAQLRRLDLLLHREILRLRASYRLTLDEFRGLYLSDEQVDALVNLGLREEGAEEDVEGLTARAEILREESEQDGRELSWGRLSAEFRLSRFERDVVLLAVAPEVDPKYETIYAYLNNNVARKWPTCELALRLFAGGPTERFTLRSHLLPAAELFRTGLLRNIESPAERVTWLSGGFAAHPALAHFLLGAEELPLSRLIRPVRAPEAAEDGATHGDVPEMLRGVGRLFHVGRAGGGTPLLVLEGPYGAGRLAAAGAVCRSLGLTLLRVDLAAARGSSESLPALTREAVLVQRMRRSGLYLEHFESLSDGEGNALPDASEVLTELAVSRLPVFLACADGSAWRKSLEGRRALHFHFPVPDYDERKSLWEEQAAACGLGLPEQAAELLAGRFELTPGRIRDAVEAACDARALAEEERPSPVFNSLMEAARTQSDDHLGRLAVKVAAKQGWDDLVLPAATLRRVKEMAAAVRLRHVVYGVWGFGERVVTGRGLKVLFAGGSGTGKTMTAGVIAADLGLDLYRIDLAGVVSKYIGETEKNLDRIFAAARFSNAILFFDEADALFGKRSEVKDAHDRYANIEVAYLLQKMEEHDGAVILASNLSKNIDAAFSRRMHYVVEFPMPDETYRERLWRSMFPERAPLGPCVDLKFLAKHFQLAGGDIRNVVLDAAFLAAQDGRVITMRHLVLAMARQTMKQGKVPSPSDFKQYHALIPQGG